MANEPTPKSFWEKPEGTTGMIAGLGLGGLGLWTIFTYLVPLLLTAALTGIELIIALIVFAFLLTMVLDRENWARGWFFYKDAMRWITKHCGIPVDSIGRMKVYIRYLRGNLEDMQEHVGVLAGQLQGIKRLMDQNENEAQESLRIAERARKQHANLQVAKNARKVGRLQKSNKKLSEVYGSIKLLHERLVRTKEVVEIVIEDREDELKVQSRERAAIYAAYPAYKSAKKAMEGDKDKRAIFDETMEDMEQDLASKWGEIQNFLDVTTSVIDSVDLEQGVMEEAGLQALEKWLNESDSLLTEPGEQKLLTHESAMPQATDRRATYVDLFRTDSKQ